MQLESCSYVFATASDEKDTKTTQAFELLKSLTLPDFSVGNWKNTIRGRVCVHDDYQSVVNWVGAETADNVYHDRHHKFTKKLIRCGYLDRAWRRRAPTYYIEVKTTPNSLCTLFFCSHPQVVRMDDMSLLASYPISNDIYLIFRVFNLGNASGTGLKIYFDPATLKSQGDLNLRADKYAVTPGSPSRALIQQVS